MTAPGLSPERWDRMRRRLRMALGTIAAEGAGREGRARDRGHPAGGPAGGRVARVLDAFDRAMEVRHDLLPSEDDFRYLHPGRTVLILAGDLDERREEVLELGALAETRDLELRVAGAPDLPLPDWTSSGGDRLSDQELLEALLAAPEEVQRLALAEALDQVRHAHLWTRPREAARAAEVAEAVFLPLSSRIHPVLERRFGWWVGRVGGRLRA